MSMSEETFDQSADYVDLSADIVSAYVSNNSLPASEIGKLLASVHAAVSGLASGGSAASAKDEVEKLTPAQVKNRSRRMP